MRGLGGLIGIGVLMAALSSDPANLYLFLFLVMGGCFVLFLLGLLLVGLYNFLSSIEISMPAPRSKPRSLPERTQPLRRYKRSRTIWYKPAGKPAIHYPDEDPEPKEIQKAVTSSPMEGPININSASISALKKMPGIGKTKATLIAKGRPYTSIGDLKQIEGIGGRTFKRISGIVTVEDT